MKLTDRLMAGKLTSYPSIARQWLLANDRPFFEAQDSHKNRPTLLFIFCMVGYILYLLLMQPEWALGGEMWAESATNYYPNSSSPSLAIKFFSTDAGYVPFPQRLLAALGYTLQLPAAAIPWFYTWSAILLTGAMVGSFCLASFRSLVESDFLRFLAAIAVLMVVDFESRTFINFTYFSAFFIAIVTALALVEKNTEVPRWAWFIPVLALSKPGVLAALPLMALVALVSKNRFRLIAVAAVIVGMAQVITLSLNPPGKAMLGAQLYGSADKLQASFQYFFGILGAFVTGSNGLGNSTWRIYSGLAVLLFCFFTIFKMRNRAGALILTGLSLLFFDMTLYCFAFPRMWNVQLARLADIVIERHILLGYFGVVLVVVGLIAAFSETGLIRRHRWLTHSGAALFFAWFCLTGWLSMSGKLNRQPGPPQTNISQWQTMSAAIDSGKPVCVPVDPFGMMYQRDCEDFQNIYLKFVFIFKAEFEFSPLPMEGNHSVLEMSPPESVQGKKLMALSILLRPKATSAIAVDVDAALVFKDGSIRHLAGYRHLPATGGLIMLSSKDAIPLDDVQQVKFTVSSAADLAYLKYPTERDPIVQWMGN